MANDIRVCDKCKHMKMKTAVSKLQKLAPDADIKSSLQILLRSLLTIYLLYILMGVM